MRRKKHTLLTKSYKSICFTLVIMLFLSIFITFNVVVALEPQIKVTPSSYTVDAGRQFHVTVTNETGNPVEGAEVSIDGTNIEPEITNQEGIAWLIAPENRDSFVIVAQYGTLKDTREVMVNFAPSWWESFISSPYFPIFFAIIFLVIVILYVNFRQKKSIFVRAKEISQEKLVEKYDEDKTPSKPIKEKTPSERRRPVRSKNDQEAKVEEIRITRPHKEKEVVPVKTEVDETEKVIQRKVSTKKDYDWFEGDKDARYEIQKITGEVDETGKDKWFEGVGDLKEKIDERVKKKDKKKDEEEQE